MDYIIGIGSITILIIVFIIAKTVLQMDKEEMREFVSLTLIMSVTGALTITAIIKGVLIWN